MVSISPNFQQLLGKISEMAAKMPTGQQPTTLGAQAPTFGTAKAAYGTPQMTNLLQQLFSGQQNAGVPGLPQCCFIFIQGEGELTQIVRQYRDDHYRSETDPISAGYKWMARWLVPLMQRLSIIQEVVRVTMTQPLTEYARWFYGKRSFTLAGWMSKLVWPTLWKVIGRIKNGR